MDNLVKRFWKGETSEAEEKALKELCGDVDFKKAHPEIINYFNVVGRQQSQLKAEGLATVILNKTSRKPNNKLPKWWVAASLIILISGGSYFFQESQPEYSQQEIAEAFAQTQEALLLVSNKFNAGVERSSFLGEFNRQQSQILNTDI